MGIVQKLKEFFSSRKLPGLKRHMAAKDYKYLSNDVRLLDDEGNAIKDPGNVYFSALAKIAEAFYDAAPYLGDDGIDQVIGWLNAQHGPDFVRKSEVGGERQHDVRLSQSQVDEILAWCRLRILELTKQLEKEDSYHEGMQRNTMASLQAKLEPLESPESKQQQQWNPASLKKVAAT